MDLNMPVTIQEAAESIRSACLYCNDNADPVGIHDVQPGDTPGELIVTLRHGCKYTAQGRPQRFLVRIEPIVKE